MEVRRHRPSPPVRVQSLQFQIADSASDPQNILEEIVWHKEQEVEQRRSRLSLLELQRKISQVPPPLDFAAALTQSPHRPSVIAEVKKASPSKGVFREDFDPVTIAQAYAANGAACLSVLTDAKFFQGSFENLQQIRQSVTLPLLCKDFILHPYQIYLARCHGADAILLIAAILSNQDLRYCLKISQGLGMAVLMEVHDREELDRVLAVVEGLPTPPLLGINNRNLKTFETRLDTTCDLLQTEGDRLRGLRMLVVSESGISQPADLARVAQAGCRAVLVGESLVKQADPGQALRQLLIHN